MKRATKLLVGLALTVLVLVQAAYLGRWLAEGWICRQLEAVLEDATGAEVSVGGIGGNWLNHIAVREVSLTGPPGFIVQRVDGLRAEIWFSLPDLLVGDLSGIRASRITARLAHIRTDGSLPGSGGEDEGGPDLAPTLTGLLPEGATIEIEDFAFGSTLAEQRGTLQLDIAPGTGSRHIEVRHAGLFARLSTHVGSGGQLGVGASLTSVDPGHLMRCLGVENEARGGQLELWTSISLEPPRLIGSLGLGSVRFDDREVSESRVSFSIDSTSIQIGEGNLQLSGISLRTDGLRAPSPFGSSAMPLEAIRGNLDLEILDSSPYTDLIPELGTVPPVQGRVQAWMDDGRLHVVQANLSSEDIRLRLGPGDIDLIDLTEGRGVATGQIGFDLIVPTSRTVEITGVGTLLTSGSMNGTVSGTLANPVLDGRIDLGPTGLAGYACERLSADLEYAGSRIYLSGLNVLELSAPPGRVLSRLIGEVTVDSADPEATSLMAAVEGRASADWWSLLDATEPLQSSPAPRFSVTGQMRLIGGLPIGSFEVRLDELQLDPHPAASISGAASITEAGILEIERLEVRGPAILDVSGSLPLDATAAGRPASFSARAPEQSVDFLAAILPGAPAQGSFSLALDVRGVPENLVFDLDLDADLQVDERLGAWWPTGSLGAIQFDSVRLALRARQEALGIEVDELRVEAGSSSVQGRGTLPFQWHPDPGLITADADAPLELTVHLAAAGPEGGEVPLSVVSTVRIDSSSLEVGDLEIRAGPGRLSGSASLGAGWTAWTGAAQASPEVAGTLELDAFSLSTLPDIFGLGALQGTLSGRAGLAGTLARPMPVAELMLRDGSVRVGGATRLEKLSARITASRDHAEISELSGTMGAGRFEGEVAARTGSRPIWDDQRDLAVSGTFVGRDVLLVNERNLRLRGHIDLELRGTATELSVGGTVRIHKGRYARRLTLLPDLSVRGGTSAGNSGGISLLPIDSPIGQSIRVDLAIRTIEDFRVRTHILDTDLVVDARLRGPASLAHLEGVVSSTAGILRLPGTSLRLDSMLATFPPDNPLQPTLTAQASGRRHGVQVQVDVQGPLFSPEIQISSIPVYPAQDLWTLVTTGSLPETLRNKGLEGQAALVGTYLAEELAAWYTGDSMEDSTSFFDRFSFVSGEDISNTGVESLIVEFQLAESVYLQGERDVWEHYNGGVVLRFRF